MEQIIFKIGGMTCGGCVRSVKNILESQPGVAAAEVSLGQGQARVRFDPSRSTAEQLRAAVEDGGFEAEADAG
jgi:copper chaperone